MDEDLDALLESALLESGLLSVPENFTERVMRVVATSPLPLPAPPRTRHRYLQWLALFGGLSLGAFELASFIFGLWAATSAY